MLKLATLVHSGQNLLKLSQRRRWHLFFVAGMCGLVYGDDAVKFGQVCRELLLRPQSFLDGSRINPYFL